MAQKDPLGTAIPKSQMRDDLSRYNGVSQVRQYM
jgi:hypothetical protein